MKNWVNLDFTDTKTVDTVSGKRQRVLRILKRAKEDGEEKKSRREKNWRKRRKSILYGEKD